MDFTKKKQQNCKTKIKRHSLNVEVTEITATHIGLKKPPVVSLTSFFRRVEDSRTVTCSRR